MPEISTGCLLSVMFVDIIRASIHDRDRTRRQQSTLDFLSQLPFPASSTSTMPDDEGTTAADLSAWIDELMTPSWTTPHHKSPLDEINEIRRNAADSLWVLKVTRRRILPLTAII